MCHHSFGGDAADVGMAAGAAQQHAGRQSRHGRLLCGQRADKIDIHTSGLETIGMNGAQTDAGQQFDPGFHGQSLSIAENGGHFIEFDANVKFAAFIIHRDAKNKKPP